jgi:hypothetical protein
MEAACFLEHSYPTACFFATVIKYVLEVKVKVKFTLEQAMKVQKGSRGIALLFL